MEDKTTVDENRNPLQKKKKSSCTFLLTEVEELFSASHHHLSWDNFIQTVFIYCGCRLTDRRIPTKAIKKSTMRPYHQQIQTLSHEHESKSLCTEPQPPCIFPAWESMTPEEKREMEAHFSIGSKWLLACNAGAVCLELVKNGTTGLLGWRAYKQ